MRPVFSMLAEIYSDAVRSDVRDTEAVWCTGSWCATRSGFIEYSGHRPVVFYLDVLTFVGIIELFYWMNFHLW